MAEKTFHSITLPGQDTARVPLTAEEFNPTKTYEIHSYCTYQGELYKCKKKYIGSAGGSWDSTYFEQPTNITKEINTKLTIPVSQASAPVNPQTGDLWIDSDENSPIYNVDASPTLNSTNAVQSGGTKVALNSLDSRKMEHGVITGDFSESVDYRVGDLVFYATTANGITTRTLYRCTTDHDTAAWNPAHFTATTLEVELQRVRDSEADTDMIGDLFGAKTTYAVGDYCIYNDNLYRCIQAVDNTGVTTPAFDPDDWTQVALANDVSDLNSALNNIESSLGGDINTKSIWELGAVKSGASGGTIVSNNKTIVTTNMISNDLEFNIVKDGFYFVVALYASDGIWKGFYNESDGVPTTDWYNGKQLISISYADILTSFPNYKIRIQIKNTSNIYPISTDDYDALTMIASNIYTKEQTDTLLNGYVKKHQDVSDAGKALVIDSNGQVSPGDVSIDIDTTLKQAGEAADAKATGDAIKDTKDEVYNNIDKITGNRPYLWINGGKILTNGSVINTNPVEDSNFCYIIIPCVSGDSFWIVASSGEYRYRQWVFIDSSKNKLLQKPNADAIITPTEIIAPENTAYLVVNGLISAEHIIYKSESIISKVTRNNNIIKNTNGIIWESGNINNNGQEVAVDRYIRSKLPLYFAAGTHISCGKNNHFYIIKYTNDYKFDSIIARNARDYTLETDGLYRFTIELGNITAALLSAYIPHNNLLLFGNKQSYVKETADAINYTSTQNTPFRITDSTVKMAHDSSIVFDGNVMWIAYYCDETTYEEALTNTTTYIEIKKVNPYTREIISSATFKVGDSIGEYTQMTDAPYIPKLNVYDDYILVYFLGYDEATSEVMIASFRVDKNTLAFSNFAPCILKDINGVAHKLNCTGLSDVYYSYTGTQVSTSIIGFTTQAQKYNDYWYNTVNTVFSGSMNTMFIKSVDGIVWTVERVMDGVGVANEASFVIKDGYVYVAARSGACLVRYSMDTTDETYAKTEIPLAIELKTAMVIFEGRIILGDNIDVVTVPSESNNRKNFGLFEVDPQTLNIKLLSRIVTQQGMHYPAFAVSNNELWMSWSNDYTFSQRMSQRTNIAVSKLIV